jgi:hypothetical protein
MGWGVERALTALSLTLQCFFFTFLAVILTEPSCDIRLFPTDLELATIEIARRPLALHFIQRLEPIAK